ncbi:hypothetical protein [Pyruvatibacter sp.]
MKAFASLIATAAFAAGAFASSAQAGDANRSWQMSGSDADAYVHVEPQSHSLNGHMALGSLSGGVGNTFGSHCCSSGGGFFIVTGSTRRGDGADGDIAFRQARDAAFGQSLGGPAIDRAFRFRANRIQRSGF